MCDHEGGSTHESGEVITGAVLTNFIDDLFCHWVALQERGDGRLAKAKVKTSGSNVVTYRIKDGQVSWIVTPPRHHAPPGATWTSISRAVQTSTRLLFM